MNTVAYTILRTTTQSMVWRGLPLLRPRRRALPRTATQSETRSTAETCWPSHANTRNLGSSRDLLLQRRSCLQIAARYFRPSSETDNDKPAPQMKWPRGLSHSKAIPMFLARDHVARRIGTIRKNPFSWNKEIAKFDRKYPAIEKFPVTEGVGDGLAVDGQTWWAHQGYGAKTMAVPPESLIGSRTSRSTSRLF